MATSDNTTVLRVSDNIESLLLTLAANAQMLEKSTLKLRTKIKADLTALGTGLSEDQKTKLLALIASTIQGNLQAKGSVAKIGTHDKCLGAFGEGSHGVDYEDRSGAYAGVCAKGTLSGGLTGGGIYGGFNY